MPGDETRYPLRAFGVAEDAVQNRSSIEGRGLDLQNATRSRMRFGLILFLSHFRLPE